MILWVIFAFNFLVFDGSSFSGYIPRSKESECWYLNPKTGSLFSWRIIKMYVEHVVVLYVQQHFSKLEWTCYVNKIHYEVITMLLLRVHVAHFFILHIRFLIRSLFSNLTSKSHWVHNIEFTLSMTWSFTFTERFLPSYGINNHVCPFHWHLLLLYMM